MTYKTDAVCGLVCRMLSDDTQYNVHYTFYIVLSRTLVYIN